MHIFSRPLGEAVKKARKKMRITQDKAAELADTNARTISAIENGKSNTRMDILYPLIRGLRIDPNDIFYPEKNGDSSAKHQLHVLIDSCTEQEVVALLKTSETVLDVIRNTDASTIGQNKSLPPL